MPSEKAQRVFEQWAALNKRQQGECLLLIRDHVNFCKNLNALVERVKGMTEEEAKAELEKIKAENGRIYAS